MIHQEHYERCQSAVIGPCLGSDEELDRLAVRLGADVPLPMVIDASALLAWGRVGHPVGQAAWVLTPHAGEMSELTGLSPDEIDADREGMAARFARQWRSILILKGPRTLIAGRELYVDSAGTSGFGTAGSGDVLAGFIGGLLARGVEPTDAAAWGVHLHALAGEAAARRGDVGMMASDVVDTLPDAIRSLRNGPG